MLVQSQPGTVVSTGSLVSPAGDQGPQGVQGVQGAVGPQGNQGIQGVTGQAAFTTTSSAFTVPAVGATVVVTFTNVTWLVVGELVYIDQAGGGGAGSPGVLQVSAIAGNNVTLLNPPSVPGTPIASTSTAGLVNALSGNATDFIGGDNACHSLAVVQGTRAVNVIGNPNFEVDARNVGGGPSTATSFGQDRWFWNNSSSSGWTTKQTDASPGGVIIPGTSVCISSKFYRFTLAIQQIALTAAQFVMFYQYVEGIFIRPLIGGSHSVSILARSSVANTVIGLCLQDTAATHSLTKLVSIPTANTWTTVSLPNIPVWTSGGTWSLAPGNVGYVLLIVLACGSTYTSPANDTWQNGNFYGASGQGNFAANPVNSTLDIGFVQHEPGSQCTPFLDKRFDTNLWECQRYFQKSGPYGAQAVASGNWETIGVHIPGNVAGRGLIRFNPRMAKAPTMQCWSASGQGAGLIYVEGNGTNYTVNGWSVYDTSVEQYTVTTAPPATLGNGPQVLGSWTADTGW
jgi:hypothetical protein